MCKPCTRRSAAATNASVSPFRLGISSLSNMIAWAVNTLLTEFPEGFGPAIADLQPHCVALLALSCINDSRRRTLVSKFFRGGKLLAEFVSGHLCYESFELCNLLSRLRGCCYRWSLCT